MKLPVLTIFLLLSTAFCQEAGSPPKFEDFPATSIFTGAPATPKLRTPSHKMFQFMIRQGARLPANFAGHYRIVEWGCGSPCSTFVVVDQKTGEVYDLPFDSLSAMDFGCPEPYDKCWGEGLIYKPNSRLLIVDGTPNMPNAEFGKYYYEWKNHRFKLLRTDIKQHEDE